MILKKDAMMFKFSIKSSELNTGLHEGDNWCYVDVCYDQANVNFNLDGYLLSREEVIHLKNKLEMFLANKIKRERISFIKNYFIFYLDGSSLKKKKLIIKFVHVNSNNDNYFLTLFEDDIVSFLNELSNYQ